MRKLNLVWGLVFLMPLLSCNLEDSLERVDADFHALQSPAKVLETTVGVWGGSGKRKIPAVSLKRSSFEVKSDTLLVRLEAGGHFGFSPRIVGWPESGEKVFGFQLGTARSQMPGRLIVEVYG
ncbi:MAG: hypothetical protein AAGA85_16780, partial [Bacteroidota bacterium]